jgi:cyclophilin family peptidyl-prolyl cis-trans isomerase
MGLMYRLLLPIAMLAGVFSVTSCVSSSANCTAGWLPESGTRGEQFTSVPGTMISASCHYSATLSTSEGQIVVALQPKAAPIAVNSFIFLVTHKFYTNILFHRVLKGFMIQTGDPTGTGTGGPGYSYKIENSGSSYTPGTLAMANTGQPNSNGSQFFICDGAECAKNLDQSWSTQGIGYTILGHVTKGLSVVHAIASVPVQVAPGSGEKSQPVTPVHLNSVRIHRSP